MYNTDKPVRSDLPTTPQRNRSSIIAVCVGAVLLLVSNFPADYSIDRAGVVHLLSLQEMNETNMLRLKEARRERQISKAAPPHEDMRSDTTRSLLSRLLIRSAMAHEEGHGTTPTAVGNGGQSAQAPHMAGRTDERSLTLKPGQGAEIKLRMKKGAKANYSWTAGGGAANYDLHGDGPKGASKSYKRGRSVPGDSGVLVAAFTGNHGWFWRNRTKKPVTVKLWVNGDYSAIKRMM